MADISHDAQPDNGHNDSEQATFEDMLGISGNMCGRIHTAVSLNETGRSTVGPRGPAAAAAVAAVATIATVVVVVAVCGIVSPLTVCSWAGTTKAGDGFDVAGRGRSGCMRIVGAHVGTGTEKGLQDGVVIRDFDRAVGHDFVGEDVGILPIDVGASGRVVAFNGDFLERSIVVAVGHVWRIPLDKTTSPVDGPFAVSRQTTGPERQLHSTGSLREGIAVGSGVPGVLAIEGADCLAVDGPCNLVGCPVNFVVMHVFMYVGEAGGVAAIFIYCNRSIDVDRQ